MPTPVMHLALAEEILGGDLLSPATRCLLARQRGPFLLGHTVPDVQTISGQGREETHFYTIPRSTDRPAYEALFAAYPVLAHAKSLPPAQAAFVAGYAAHLLLDELRQARKDFDEMRRMWDQVCGETKKSPYKESPFLSFSPSVKETATNPPGGIWRKGNKLILKPEIPVVPDWPPSGS